VTLHFSHKHRAQGINEAGTSHFGDLRRDFGRRAFSSAAPQIWNHIPTTIRSSQSLDSFKRHLKTHYFASP